MLRVGPPLMAVTPDRMLYRCVREGRLRLAAAGRCLPGAVVVSLPAQGRAMGATSRSGPTRTGSCSNRTTGSIRSRPWMRLVEYRSRGPVNLVCAALAACSSPCRPLGRPDRGLASPPIFLLRFARGGAAPGQPARGRCVARYAMRLPHLVGQVPVPAPLYFLIMLDDHALPGVLPYVAADRVLVRRRDGSSRRSCSRAAWVVTEYLSTQLFSPYGSWARWPAHAGGSPAAAHNRGADRALGDRIPDRLDRGGGELGVGARVPGRPAQACARCSPGAQRWR